MIDSGLLIDVVATYLYALKYVAMVVAVVMLVSGIDDLFIDLVYWVRRGWRALTVYRRNGRMDHDALYGLAEKPLAIMVPAWQETGVIGHMAELAATMLDYENYHIFVGTYPNDPDTRRDVDAVCARFPNVHKVVCARPGPTSKADCLNNVLDAILRFEQCARLTFAGFILHDAEDVVSDLELRLFNYLVERKDLIQIPVYPFERQWHKFTSMHYMDEFAELHGKDVPVREAIAGQVPSAGVGTCFSRRAVLALLADGDGIAFDVQSLTEDYDIGFRLKAKGMHEIFVRFPVLREQESKGLRGFGKSRHESSVICVREYFPDSAATAIRQKSRWIIGIVYQGYKTHGWTGDRVLDYFLWRDRKGAINNFVSFAAMLILLQLGALLVLQLAWPGAPRFLSIFEGVPWFRALLLANLVLMANRMLQRVIFVSGYYGFLQGLLSIARLFWSNYINFMANVRAIRQIVAQGDPRRVAWDKTTHDFPSIGDGNRARRPLGDILVAQGALHELQLEAALSRRTPGLRLGSQLVHDGLITTAQLAEAIAEQSGTAHESIEPYRPTPDLLATLPAAAALRYTVVPLRESADALVVASESTIDPVALAALARRLRRPVRYSIARKGEVTVALRSHYCDRSREDPWRLLEDALRQGELDEAGAAALWQRFVSRQVLLSEVLIALGHIDSAAFRALLLSHDHACPLGEYLVEQEVISPATLEQALALQAQLQASMRALLDAERRCQPLQPSPGISAVYA